jgi:hypothetical protein
MAAQQVERMHTRILEKSIFRIRRVAHYHTLAVFLIAFQWPGLIRAGHPRRIAEQTFSLEAAT